MTRAVLWIGDAYALGRNRWGLAGTYTRTLGLIMNGCSGRRNDCSGQGRCFRLKVRLKHRVAG